MNRGLKTFSVAVEQPVYQRRFRPLRTRLRVYRVIAGSPRSALRAVGAGKVLTLSQVRRMRGVGEVWQSVALTPELLMSAGRQR